MDKNKQKKFTVSALSFLHCTSDLHQYHVSLLFHMADLVFQDLTPHQGRDSYGFSFGIFTMETRKEVGNTGMDPERNKRLDRLWMEDPTSKCLSSFKILNVVYLPEKRNSNQSCSMSNISPDGNIRWNNQDFTRFRWSDKRLDFGGALDLTDKVHVLALAVFTLLPSSNWKSQMYFKLTLTIESDSMILVGPCQLTIIYANNKRIKGKSIKTITLQFIFLLMNEECAWCDLVCSDFPSAQN